MKRTNFFILFFFLLPGLSVYSQEPLTLNYANFIEIVIKNNPLSKSAENYSSYSKALYQSARGSYDPQLDVDVTNKFFNGTNYYTRVNGSIKQAIFTSQYLKAGYEYGSGQYLDPEYSTSAYGLPYLGVEASMLQGLTFDKRRAEVLKSKNYLDYFKAEQAIRMNDLLYQSSTGYFELVYSKKLLSLYSYFLSLAEKRLRGIEDLANSGEKPIVDTIEAAIYTQGRALDLQSASIEFTKKENELSRMIWLSDEIPFALSSQLMLTDSLEKCYEQAKTSLLNKLNVDSLNNPIIKQYKAKQNVLDIEKRWKKELIKPKLDLSYNLLSDYQNINVPVFSLNNYKWGASLSFPLFLRQSRNEYKMAKVNSSNNLYDLNFKQNEVELKQDFLKQSISVLIQQLVVAERSTKYSKLLVEAERLKFENGESSLFMLNTREAKWMESEIKLAEYKLKFIKSLLGIIHLNGNLNYLF